MELRIFDYNEPVAYLNAALEGMQAQNPQFSLRAWARQLGLSHVAMLSMVLNRKRRLLPSLSGKIRDQFVKQGKLNETEARYFDMLVLFSNASSEGEKNFYERLLVELRPDQRFYTLELDKLRIISDWYHIAILEMTYLKDFQSDPQWIRLQLGESVSLAQVREAIERMLRLGLLEEGPNGRLQKAAVQIATPTDTPDEGLKKFHAAMIEKGFRALESQAVEDRDITGYTMTIAKEKLPEAKRMIRDFRRKLAAFLETPGGDSVYQLNIQLFDLLQKRK